ncbi:DivIVA domain-containing protein, partial [Nocardia abscessus]
MGRRGYNEEEVGAFLDLVAASLAHGGPGSLTI